MPDQKEFTYQSVNPIWTLPNLLRTFATSWPSLVMGKNAKPMKYQIDKQETYCVFKLDEQNLNTTNAPRLKSELIFLSQEGVRNLILDISAVKFVDSSGLSAILTANRIWNEDSSLVLVGPLHPAVKRLIEISKLDEVLTVINTQSEAIDYVMMREVERSLLDEGTDS